MKKGNLLSKAEMKNVSGGLRDVCDPDECVNTIGYWDDGCPEGFYCVTYDCSAGSRTVNKCIPESQPEPNPWEPVPVD